MLVLLCLVAAAAATPANAAFPGKNGKLLIWDAPGCFETMDPDGTGRAETGLCQGDPLYAWTPMAISPDGTHAVFTDGCCGFYTAKLDGTDFMQVLGGGGGDTQNGVAWSPDGAYVAVSDSFGPSHDGFYGSSLDVRPANGGPGGWTPHYCNSDVTPGCQQRFFMNLDWSPDGTSIAFDENNRIKTIVATGGSETQLTTGPDFKPEWSPNGDKIAFYSERDGNWDVYVMNRDGTGLVQLTDDPASDFGPIWSPDGTKIGFASTRDGDYEIYTMNPDGTGVTQLTHNSSDDGLIDWQPVPINAYPRPKGATPFLTYLVPAYDACASPNRVHGYPLAFASCNPPTQSSNALTVGSADSNGKPTKSVSSVRFDTIVGNPSTPADEADVKITAQVIDVYTQAGLADYAGELRATTPLRITDKLNTPHPGGLGAGTVSDIPYGFTIPCAETADTTIGGACLLSTSADALAPGAVTEGKRAIWGLGAVEVYDASDALFMKQGIFVP